MTIRRLMFAVVVAAVLLSCGGILWNNPPFYDDKMDHASSVDKPTSWDVSGSPKVIVEASVGQIIVTPSLDGRVTAFVTRDVVTKNLWEAAAKDALRFIQVEQTRDGDTIRIVTRPTADVGRRNSELIFGSIRVSTTVELSVPEGTRLDLRTKDCPIWVVGKPGEVRARSSGGIMRFDLSPVRLADGSTGILKLEGKFGEAFAEVDGEGYRYRGIVEPVR